MKKCVILLAAGLLLQACALVKPPMKNVNPQTPVTAKDPLIGQVIDTRSQTAVSFETLVDRLANYDVIYLSEKHDNPMHHAVQHRVIQELINRGRKPVLGFEFFAMAHTPLLLNYVDSKNAGHSEEMDKGVDAQMRLRLEWEDQTDDMWGYYLDLLRLARDNDLWAAGLDLTSSQKRRITRKGLTGLTALEQDQLFSTGLAEPAYETYMKTLFKQVHCGMGHDQMLIKLYDTWLFRNDKMALSITQLHRAGVQADPKQGPVVIIMGNGHTEYGLGVVDRVNRIDPDISQINLSLAEVLPDPVPLADYLTPLDLEGHPPVLPADYIWFTQRVTDEDPCTKFKASMEKMKKKAASEKTLKQP